MKPQDKHPDELSLLRMVDGELSLERIASTRSHVVDCAACQAAYEALKTETEILRSSLRLDDEALPDSIREEGGLAWFLLAGIGLAALGISQFWSWFVGPFLRGMERVGIDAPGLFTTVVIRGLLYRGWTDMASILMQGALYVSVAVVVGTLAFLGWRRLRAFHPMTLAVGITLLLAGLPRPSEAAEIQLKQQLYVLPAGETIGNDLIVSGEIVRIEGTVDGDLIVAARLVEVSGKVSGDIMGFAEEFDVTGEVGGNVRTASRSLDIQGLVARNVSAAGETLRVGGAARIGGSFTAACRESILGAPIGRDLLVAAQTHQIDSRLEGSALLIGESLTIGDHAVIEGKVEFHGHREPEVSANATLASPVDFRRVEDGEGDRGPFAWLTTFVFFWAAAFVLGAAFLLIAPGMAQAITAVHLPQYGKSLLVGILAAGGIAALAVGFMITIVGLPLGLVTLFFWLLGLYLAQIYVGLYVGRILLGAPTDRSQLLVRLAVGLLALHIAKSIPVLGHLVTIVVALWGFGALMLWVADNMTARVPGPALPQPQEVG